MFRNITVKSWKKSAADFFIRLILTPAIVRLTTTATHTKKQTLTRI